MLRRVILALLFVFAALIGTLALPVPLWRTGRLSVPPLQLSAPQRSANPATRVWIDTDAACGFTPRTDVDDCLAVWLLLSGTIEGDVIGVSTVHGNAPLEVTDDTTRDLIAQTIRDGTPAPVVHRGSAVPIAESPDADTPARVALTRALESGRLTILALGPLTNIAQVLAGRPDLRSNVEDLIAVMGRRTGHLFHPSEGSGGGGFFGHGPVFRDFNFSADPGAAAMLVQADLPLTLIPYDAATGVEITREDLRQFAARGKAGEWIAMRSDGWLRYWEQDVGRGGFYPFDVMAAAYVLEPSLFRCANVRAWVGADPRLFVPLLRPTALLVEAREDPTPTRTTYCPEIGQRFNRRLRDWMFAP